jgi:hypothetical protein
MKITWGLVAMLGIGQAFAEPPIATIDVSRDQSSEMQEATRRGEASMNIGDISAARRWLLDPAHLGSAEAIRCLAQTYDPRWLLEHHIRNPELANPIRAAELYLAASKAGDEVATALLNPSVKE